MKNILILIDFTEMADLAIEQAFNFAKLKHATLTFCHVTAINTDKNNLEINSNFKPFINKAIDSGVNYRTHIAYGNLIAGAKETIAKIRPDLVVAGTHGKHGILQHLFGSRIFNLVKEIASPILILNNHSKLVEQGYNKILVPVSHHTTYLEMLEMSTKLLASNGKIVIFALVKYGLPLDKEIIANIAAAQKFLNANDIANEYLEIVTENYSVGYAKDTLQYVKDHEVDLITIITKASSQNAGFANIDKENIILNDLGFTVLCVDY